MLVLFGGSILAGGDVLAEAIGLTEIAATRTIVMRPGSGLDRLQYDLFGGTAVSTSHHHMDAYALRLEVLRSRFTC